VTRPELVNGEYCELCEKEPSPVPSLCLHSDPLHILEVGSHDNDVRNGTNMYGLVIDGEHARSLFVSF